jgi:hypothetical protein
MEVAAVHADLSEQAYKAQAQEIMRSGERCDHMCDMLLMSHFFNSLPSSALSKGLYPALQQSSLGTLSSRTAIRTARLQSCPPHGYLYLICYSVCPHLTPPGPMTPEKTSYLEDMRSQLGLTKEQGDKLVKQVGGGCEACEMCNMCEMRNV